MEEDTGDGLSRVRESRKSEDARLSRAADRAEPEDGSAEPRDAI
jgi:hypothetical protein